MPQRYVPDAEVLQEMVDYESKPTKRATPKGLDVMAAIGIPQAERILIDELKEDKQWSDYMPTLKRMKERMAEIDWDASVSNRWIATMKDVNSQPENAPYFMNTPQWGKKNLNTALASWAELKHDAILYAKQPFGAECGGGGPPEPICRGYVEPNVAYWQKAIDLLDATKSCSESTISSPRKSRTSHLTCMRKRSSSSPSAKRNSKARNSPMRNTDR